jgi:hypothetical protein
MNLRPDHNHIGIVGSRAFNDARLMERAVEALRKKHGPFRLVSGGAKGADTLAEHACRAQMPDQQPIIFLPNSEKAKAAFGNSFRDRAFGRNEWIVDNSQFIVAFFAGASMTGGTLNTVNHAKRQGKQIFAYFAKTGRWETIPAAVTLSSALKEAEDKPNYHPPCSVCGKPTRIFDGRSGGKPVCIQHLA